MFRVKVGMTFGLLVVIATAIAAWAVPRRVVEEAETRVPASVERAADLAERSMRLESLDLTALAERAARDMSAEIAPPTAPPAEGAPPGAPAPAPVRVDSAWAYERVEGYTARLEEEGRKPTLAAIVDRGGKVLARDLDPKALVGEDFKARYPAVGTALQGRASKDTWTFVDGKMMNVGVAPLHGPGDEVAGALIFGYVETAADARDDNLGTEVAYFHDGKVHASSFLVSGTEDQQDVKKVEALTKELFGASALAQKALAGDEPSDLVRLQLDGEEFVAIAGPMVGNAHSKSTGYVVLSSLTAALAPARAARTGVLLFGLVALLITLGALTVVMWHFIRSEDRIELGVAEIISGNLDYQFQTFDEFEGLANALNVMLARLLGRPEPTDTEEEGAEAAQGLLHFTEPDGVPPETVQALASEPDEDHYRRLFQEFFSARSAIGLPQGDLDEETFVRVLRANEAVLRAKHKCGRLRFLVMQQGNTVSLRPVPIP